MIGTSGTTLAQIRKIIRGPSWKERGAVLLDDGKQVFIMDLSPYLNRRKTHPRPVAGDEVSLTWRVDTDSSLEPTVRLQGWEITDRLPVKEYE